MNWVDRLLIVVAGLAIWAHANGVWAIDINLKEFQPGHVADAHEINGNFCEVVEAIDELDRRLSTVEAQ